jgi:hypothetical protein
MSYPKSSIGTHDLGHRIKVIYQNNPGFSHVTEFDYWPSWVDNAVQYTGNHPRWKELLHSGIGVTTSITGTKVRAKTTKCYIQCKHKVNINSLPPDYDEITYEHTGIIGGGSGIPVFKGLSNPVEAESRAAEQFLAKCRETLSSFQGGVFVAELGKAIRGIKRPAEGMRNFLTEQAKHAKRVRRRMRERNHSDRDISKAIATSWLEKQYHWGPLASDMENSAESLAKLSLLEESKRVFVDWADKYSEDGPLLVQGEGPVRAMYRIRYEEESRCKFYGVCSAYNELNPGAFSTLLRTRLGLTLGDAAPTLWELIPFSFVADYFSNVGSMISAYSFPSASIRWMNRGLLHVCRHKMIDPVQIKHLNNASETYEYGAYDPGSFEAEREDIVRTPFEAKDLIPGFRLKIPGIDGWAKWLNLAALSKVISSP